MAMIGIPNPSPILTPRAVGVVEGLDVTVVGLILCIADSTG
jgi:hypothetical protein